MGLANKITVVRILLVPFFLYMLWGKNILPSVILFSIIMFGDILDGYVARKFKEVSKLGTVLDSIADRIVMIPTFTILILKYDVPLIPSLLVLTRDFIYIIGLILLLFLKDRKKYIVQPIRLGKLTTLMLTATAISIFLGFYEYIFISITIVLSVTSAALYVKRAFEKHIRSF